MRTRAGIPFVLLAVLALGCSKSEEPAPQPAPAADLPAERETAPVASTPSPAPTPEPEPAAPGPAAATTPAPALAPAPRPPPEITRGVPEPPTQAVLRGVVFDENGVLVPQASVLLVAGPDARTPYARIAGTDTDRQGSFRLAVEPGVGGLLLVVADGWLPMVEPCAPREAGEHQLGAIALESGAALEGVAEGCGPRGIVYAALQASYTSANYIDTTDLAWIDGRPVKTYVYGRTEGERFRLAGLVPGTYEVVAQRMLLGGDCRVEGIERRTTHVDAPAKELVLRDDDPLVRIEARTGGKALEGVRIGPVGATPCVTSSLGAVYWRLLPETGTVFLIEADGFLPIQQEIFAPARGEISQVLIELERQ